MLGDYLKSNLVNSSVMDTNLLQNWVSRGDQDLENHSSSRGGGRGR